MTPTPPPQTPPPWMTDSLLPDVSVHNKYARSPPPVALTTGATTTDIHTATTTSATGSYVDTARSPPVALATGATTMSTPGSYADTVVDVDLRIIIAAVILAVVLILVAILVVLVLRPMCRRKGSYRTNEIPHDEYKDDDQSCGRDAPLQSNDVLEFVEED